MIRFTIILKVLFDGEQSLAGIARLMGEVKATPAEGKKFSNTIDSTKFSLLVELGRVNLRANRSREKRDLKKDGPKNFCSYLRS